MSPVCQWPWQPQSVIALLDFNSRRSLLAAILVGGLLPASLAANESLGGPDQAQRVLLPSAAPRLQAAFDRAAPTWRLESAAIARDRVDVRACVDPVCHGLVLLDPASCRGVVAGPWCVVWTGAQPPEAPSLHRALAADAAADYWHLIAARPVQPPIVHAPPPAPTPVSADPPPSASATTAAPARWDPQAIDATKASQADAELWWRLLVLSLVVGLAALLMLRGLRQRPR